MFIPSTIEEHTDERMWKYLIKCDARRFDENMATAEGEIYKALSSLNISDVMVLLYDDQDGIFLFHIWLKDKLQATKFYISFC